MDDTIIQIVASALITASKVAGPVLGATLAVGLTALAVGAA